VLALRRLLGGGRVPRLDPAEISELHARVCKALADPKRLLIINELRDGPRPVGAIASALGTSQPNVSRHLAVLRDRGFVSAQRFGSSVHYTLASPVILQAIDLLREFMAEELGWRAPGAQRVGGHGPGSRMRAAPRAEVAEIYELNARVCKAIADGKRLLIINELRDGPRTVGAVVTALGIPQANASQHLAVLRDRGILEARRAGSNVCYSLTSPKLIEAVDLLSKFVAQRRGKSLGSLAG
jgi:DNA-binding transcriptional ArsR family regulator